MKLDKKRKVFFFLTIPTDNLRPTITQNMYSTVIMYTYRIVFFSNVRIDELIYQRKRIHRENCGVLDS